MRWERFFRNCAFAVILFLLVDALEATHLPGAASVRAYIAYAFTTDWDYQATFDRAKAGARGLATFTERLGLRLGPPAGSPAPAGQAVVPGMADPKPVAGEPAAAGPEGGNVTVARVSTDGLAAPEAGTADLPERDARVAAVPSAPPVGGHAPAAPAAPEREAGHAQSSPPAHEPSPEPAREPAREQVPARIPSGVHLAWPTQGTVTESFGYRRHPISRLLGPHEGIDVAVPSGAPVCAAAPGKVTAVFRGLTGGLTVVLTHPGFTTRYLHLSSAKVKVGETVNRGALIALAGATGVATGPHLHFEVRVSGQPVDPLPLLPR